jgi:4-hydroxy-tetrahydrodipicolinate synthase
MNIRGCGTALVTPFRYDGSVDEPALRDLVAWQIDSGIDFLVSCGTTGEAPTLSHKEWLRVVDITIEVVAGRVPIVVGATSNCTREAIEKSRVAAERVGVDAILSASPYYNKPTQEGQYQHFRAIAQAIKKPVILYNVPGRTAANIEPATLARLARLSNIIAVKEASGNMSQIVEVFQAVPPQFLVFSGDDALTLPIMGLGGAGVISVASNEIPREMAEMTRAALNNDWETARRIHRRYLPLMNANFIESNPLPVKAALAMMGKIREVYRLPLVRMKEDTRSRLQRIVSEAGLPVQPEAPRPERGRRHRDATAAVPAAPQGAVPSASVTSSATATEAAATIRERGSEVISEKESEKILDSASSGILERTSEEVSAESSEGTPAGIAESASERLSEADSEKAAVTTPESDQKDVLESGRKSAESMPTPAGKTPPSEPKDTQEGATSKQPLETKQPDSRPPSQHVRESASQSTSQNVPQPTSEPTPGSVPQFGPQTTAESTPDATEALAQPAEPLAFYVYESWQAGPRRTILHRSSCNSYRNGRGRTGSPDAAYARWHGPFPTSQEARNVSRGLQGVLIRSECKCISKR